MKSLLICVVVLLCATSIYADFKKEMRSYWKQHGNMGNTGQHPFVRGLRSLANVTIHPVFEDYKIQQIGLATFNEKGRGVWAGLECNLVFGEWLNATCMYDFPGGSTGQYVTFSHYDQELFVFPDASAGYMAIYNTESNTLYAENANFFDSTLSHDQYTSSVPATISNGVIHAGHLMGGLRAYDKNANLLGVWSQPEWTDSAGTRPLITDYGCPAVQDDTIFYCTYDLDNFRIMQIRAIQYHAGNLPNETYTEKWLLNIGKDSTSKGESGFACRGSPVLYDDVLYVVNDFGSIVAIDSATGNINWYRTMADIMDHPDPWSGYYSTPVINPILGSDEMVMLWRTGTSDFYDYTNIYNNGDLYLVGIDVENGTLLHKIEYGPSGRLSDSVGHPTTGQLASADGIYYIIFGRSDNNLKAIDLADWTELWNFKFSVFGIPMTPGAGLDEDGMGLGQDGSLWLQAGSLGQYPFIVACPAGMAIDEEGECSPCTNGTEAFGQMGCVYRCGDEWQWELFSLCESCPSDTYFTDGWCHSCPEGSRSNFGSTSIDDCIAPTTGTTGTIQTTGTVQTTGTTGTSGTTGETVIDNSASALTFGLSVILALVFTFSL